MVEQLLDTMVSLDEELVVPTPDARKRRGRKAAKKSRKGRKGAKKSRKGRKAAKKSRKSRKGKKARKARKPSKKASKKAASKRRRMLAKKARGNHTVGQCVHAAMVALKRPVTVKTVQKLMAKKNMKFSTFILLKVLRSMINKKVVKGRKGKFILTGRPMPNRKNMKKQRMANLRKAQKALRAKRAAGKRRGAKKSKKGRKSRT